MTQENLIAEVMEVLKKDPRLSDLSIVEAFRAVPGKSSGKITAAVGIGSSKLVPAALSGFQGDGRTCKVEILLEITVSAPPKLGGGGCVDAFSRIGDVLVFCGSFCLQSISCGQVVYGGSSGKFSLTGKIGVTGYISSGESHGA